ncbi:uncharacterized protein [Procambarus clarkii]|uniref:uncharacterized protein n=1 Tax=Procambarus clarkii TaxID=6728 RepID=UPI003742048A
MAGHDSDGTCGIALFYYPGDLWSYFVTLGVMVVGGRWVVVWAWLVVASVDPVTPQGTDVSPLALPGGQPSPPCLPYRLPTHPLIRCELSKRQPFYHWGGKRSPHKFGLGLPINLREVYLALFQNARSQPLRLQATEGELKRATFNPWGGKQSDPIHTASLTSDAFNDSPSKGNTFTPWGGKRSAEYYLEDESPLAVKEDIIPYVTTFSDEGQTEEIKEGSTATWGGNRVPSVSDGKNDILTEEEPSDFFLLNENLPFPDVGNLRYKREVESYVKSLENIKNSLEEKKAESGKSTQKDDQSQESNTSEVKRARYSAWVGKRPDLQAIQDAVRRLKYQEPQMAERRGFSAWAGKRSLSTVFSNIMSKKAFSAWAGKRSNYDFEQNILKTKVSPWAEKLSDKADSTTNVATVESSPFNDQERASFNKWIGNAEKRQAFNAWAGKRSDTEEKRQAFSAWAGKRSDNDEKRHSFSAWAGKRREDDEKRHAFSSWAGKRSNNDEKRQAFSPWAGKRSDNEEKRQAFSSWAGKRSENDEKRQAFSSWAGKRSDNDEKRQEFSAWAGKRSDDEKRQAFSAWAGKRSNVYQKQQSFSPWAGKRSYSNKKRQSFSAWAGKRSSDNIKRETFSAWAGKRENQKQLNEDNSQQITDILHHLHNQNHEFVYNNLSNNWDKNDFPFHTEEDKWPNHLSADSQITDLLLPQL